MNASRGLERGRSRVESCSPPCSGRARAASRRSTSPTTCSSTACTGSRRARSTTSSARAGWGARRPPACWPRSSSGARLASGDGAAAASLQSPADAARYLLPRYASRPVETFGLLALDARHRLRREAIVSVGCLTASLVHPREVFQEAVVSRAAALVLFHNHPSGDPEPSAEDLALTRRLCAAGSLMGIEILDHLVLGAGRYVSLKERGVL